MLTGASTVAPLLLLMAQPLLTRLYEPSEYGAFGIFEASLAICVALSALGFNLPIPVRDSDLEAEQLLLISVITVALLSLCLYLPLDVYKVEIGQLFGAELLVPYLWLLPVAVFCSGCYQAFNSWALRRGAFPDIARARFAQGLTQVAAQVCLGLMGMNVLGLLAGLVIGRMSALLALAWKTGIAPLKAAASPFSPRALGDAAWRNRSFPMLASWSSVISVLSLQASVLLVGYWHGAETVGFFSLAFLVVAGPLHIVNGAVVQAFLGEASTLDRGSQLAAASLELFRSLSRIGLVPALLFASLAPDLFGAIFGDSWRAAGEFARLLAPALIISFIGAHLPAIVILRGEQRRELQFSCSHLAARVAALTIGALFGAASLSVGLYAMVSILFLLSYDSWLLRIAGNSPGKIARLLLGEGCIALLLVSPLWLSNALPGEEYFWPALFVSVVAWLARLVSSVSRAELSGAGP
ncbi:MAG: oligosaccharide flippase family protein [Halioglobus sp.]|nr:oligosaccharide flippase family protein [Halioglobus sp.]